MRLLIALALAGLAYIIPYWLYKRLWYKNLGVEISYDRDLLYENEENEMIEVITNQKKLPLPILQVKFRITRSFLLPKQESSTVTDLYYRNEFFTVAGLQKITRKYPFKATHRGYFSMSGMDVICRPFFLESKMIMSLEQNSTVCVLPRRIDAKDVPADITSLIGNIERNVHVNDDPFAFAGIREYQPYDSIHNINWKSTARTQTLQVNTFNTTFSKKVIILLNVEANYVTHAEDVVEWAIRIASHLSAKLIRQQIPVAFYTNGRDIITNEEPVVDAGADLSHIRSIEVALARLDLTKRARAFSDFIKIKKQEMDSNSEIIIVSNSRKENVIDAYQALKNSGLRVSFIAPEYEMLKMENDTSKEDVTEWLIKNDDENISVVC